VAVEVAALAAGAAVSPLESSLPPQPAATSATAAIRSTAMRPGFMRISFSSSPASWIVDLDHDLGHPKYWRAGD
jgi:hypothetical protein